jgi:hypothetical protein
MGESSHPATDIGRPWCVWLCKHSVYDPIVLQHLTPQLCQCIASKCTGLQLHPAVHFYRTLFAHLANPSLPTHVYELGVRLECGLIGCISLTLRCGAGARLVCQKCRKPRWNSCTSSHSSTTTPPGPLSQCPVII